VRCWRDGAATPYHDAEDGDFQPPIQQPLVSTYNTVHLRAHVLPHEVIEGEAWAWGRAWSYGGLRSSCREKSGLTK
jgi:hypothetical protein